MRLEAHTQRHRLANNTPANPLNKLALVVVLGVALIAGAMFPFALAPYGMWPLAIISPAMLYALLIAPSLLTTKQNQRSGLRAFLIGEAYGTGLWCVGAFWLYTSIHTYGDTPSWLALLMIGFVGLAMGLFHGVMALVFVRVVGRQPASFASLWVLQEWLKTWVFTGFPWLFVGYAVTNESWLTGYAPLFGVLALSFILVFIAASLVDLYYNRNKWAVVSLGLVAIGLVLMPITWTKPTTNKPLSVSLVQGNIPQDLKWLTEYRLKTLQIYARLSVNEWGRDLVIWPEASIPMFQTDAWPFITQVAAYAQEKHTSWVTGVPYKDDAAYNPATDKYPPFYNSLIALGYHANGLYKKQRLVPFGEYIPFEGALDWVLPNLARSQDIMSFSEGLPKQQPLIIQNQALGSAVCYEVAYPNITRLNAKNTNFLVTVSNDAWFGTSAGPLQHLQMVQMRAIETGRWFVRATNTGVTAIIDDKGHIIARAPQFKPAILRGELQGKQGNTPYMNWGNYPILLLIFALLLASRLGLNKNI